jgi:hypothetical protein
LWVFGNCGNCGNYCWLEEGGGRTGKCGFEEKERERRWGGEKKKKMAEASSTTTASDGPGEEAVLDRMLTRLALTQDTQLEKVLSKLLPLAISRLGSSHHPTRLKVKQT